MQNASVLRLHIVSTMVHSKPRCLRNSQRNDWPICLPSLSGARRVSSCLRQQPFATLISAPAWRSEIYRSTAWLPTRPNHPYEILPVVVFHFPHHQTGEQRAHRKTLALPPSASIESHRRISRDISTRDFFSRVRPLTTPPTTPSAASAAFEPGFCIFFAFPPLF